jgi:hypothetical protein
MPSIHAPLRLLVASLALILPLAACSVDVTDGGADDNSNVNIRTPAGNLTVNSDVDARDTGLSLYPGARPAKGDDKRERAGVNIGTSLFGVKVVAANFESDATPQEVVAFYRDQMEAFGTVTECHGDVDFNGRKGARRASCKEGGRAEETQLLVGPEERQRIVAVKPHGAGSEFALVYVETRAD